VFLSDCSNLLVQFLKPLIDHDCAKSLRDISMIEGMVDLRSDDATISVAPERCLYLLIPKAVSFAASACLAQL
jgi:hypothetical protein